MATHYCAQDNISDFLQIDSFGSGTTPTDTVVDTFINNNEKYIDEYTDHAWHSGRYGSVTKEPLKIQHVVSNTIGNRGVIQLDHYPIAVLTNFYVWTGGTYVDYVASGSYTAGSFTDPLSGNYWVDTDNGKVYLKDSPTINISSAPTGTQAYATYTYGTASTPADIRKACMLLTASNVISMWDNSDSATISSGDLKLDAMDILDMRSRQGRIIPVAKIPNRSIGEAWIRG
jgi:hypothetical protein